MRIFRDLLELEYRQILSQKIKYSLIKQSKNSPNILKIPEPDLFLHTLKSTKFDITNVTCIKRNIYSQDYFTVCSAQCALQKF